MERPAELRDLLTHAAWLRRLADHLVRGTDEAPGDLVQETWMAALRSPPSSERPARPWLAEVLRNAFRKRRRDRTRLRRREGNAFTGVLASPSPEDLLGRAEAQRLLGELVLALDEPYRTAVLLRYFEDLAPAEIARLAHEPAGTVRWRLNEALRRLRAAIAARESGEAAGRTLRALIPLLPVQAPSALGSMTNGGTLAVMLNAKTKLGVAAIVAALAAGAVVRSRLDEPAPAAGPPAVTPAEATAARMAGTTGDEPATAVRARAPAVPKLQAASSSSAPPIAYGKPHPIAWADLPPHFRSVLSQIALGRTIQMRDRRLDRWKGQIRTRLTFEVEGVRHEVMLDEQGTLVASEVDFHPGELPPVVLAGIKADSPDAVIVKADRQWRYDEPVYFDVDLLQDGRRLQLHVSEDGRITEKKWK